MKETIIFDCLGFKAFTIKEALRIIPKIGETVNIGGLLPTNQDRKEMNAWQNSKSIYVVDIYHEFHPKDHIITIKLSNDWEDTNDFYIALKSTD